MYRRLLESEEDRLGLAVDGGGKELYRMSPFSHFLKKMVSYFDTSCRCNICNFLKYCFVDGLVTRVIPPTPIVTRNQNGKKWVNGKSYNTNV